jgi:hypothetical protein
MAVPVHDIHPDEVRIHDQIPVRTQPAPTLVERKLPTNGKSAGDQLAGPPRWTRKRVALGIGMVLVLIAAFFVGYVVRGSDSETISETAPAVVPAVPDYAALDQARSSADALERWALADRSTWRGSPDAIDRPAAQIAPMTPVSPDAIDRAPVASAGDYGSADAAERWING